METGDLRARLGALTLLFLTSLGCQSTQRESPWEPRAGREAIAEADARAREEMDTELAAYIARARATFPDVRRRFEDRLPANHALIVTTRVRDEHGNTKDVFIEVDAIRDGRILGRIASETGFLTGVRKGQTHMFREEELIDWMITGPSGVTEGNYVGQFLEAQRARRP